VQAPGAPAASRRVLRPVVFHSQHEVPAMPPGLYAEEGGVEAHAHQPEEGLLGSGEGGAGGGLGVIRRDETEHRQRNDHAQVGIRTLEIVELLPVAPGPEQERCARHPVEHDHDDREQGVADHGGAALLMHHHGRDARGLDDRHGQGQDERAEGLAQVQGEFLGMPHHGQCGSQDDCEQPEEDHDLTGKSGAVGIKGCTCPRGRSARGDLIPSAHLRVDGPRLSL
jgi:hypothetical protein